MMYVYLALNGYKQKKEENFVFIVGTIFRKQINHNEVINWWASACGGDANHSSFPIRINISIEQGVINAFMACFIDGSIFVAWMVGMPAVGTVHLCWHAPGVENPTRWHAQQSA